MGLGTSQTAILLSAGAGLSCLAGLLVTLGAIPAAGSLGGAVVAVIALVVLAQRVRV
jgi:hypothetical protein